MILKNIERTELVRQLKALKNMYDHTSSEVQVVNRHGNKIHIVKVDERKQGIFLCPLYPDLDAFLAMAEIFGSKMHEFDLDEIISALESYKSEKVWYGWPNDDPHTVIGKVLGIGKSNNHLIATLFPVPDDIEQVNERVRQMCADYGCESAAAGQQCGDCAYCGTCAILKEVDAKITKN